MTAADYRKLILAFRDFLTIGMCERASVGRLYSRINVDGLAECLARLERERDERHEGHQIARAAEGVE